MRVWSRKEAYNQTEFALSVAVDVLRFYETIFDITYPLPKQGPLECNEVVMFVATYIVTYIYCYRI